MAEIGKREESERKVVRLTIELSADEKDEIARLKREVGPMTVHVWESGTLEFVFEEPR